MDDKFFIGNEIGKGGVFGPEKRTAVFDHVALQRGLTVDECGDDVAGTWLFDFEDGDVAMANVRADHGLATHSQRKGFAVTVQPECGGIDGDGTIWLLVLHFRITGGDGSIDGNVHDFVTLEILWEDHGTSLMGVALDDAFFLQGAEVTHGSGLAGEAEMPLNVTSAGHDALLPLMLAQVGQKFLLTVREFDGCAEHTNSVRSNKVFGKLFFLRLELRSLQRHGFGWSAGFGWLIHYWYCSGDATWRTFSGADSLEQDGLVAINAKYEPGGIQSCRRIWNGGGAIRGHDRNQVKWLRGEPVMAGADVLLAGFRSESEHDTLMRMRLDDGVGEGLQLGEKLPQTGDDVVLEIGFMGHCFLSEKTSESIAGEVIWRAVGRFAVGCRSGLCSTPFTLPLTVE